MTKTFMKTNWFNVASLIFSSFAFIISVINLLVATNSSAAHIEISNEIPQENVIAVEACQNNGTHYYVWLYLKKSFEFTNTGGRTATLNRVRLEDDRRQYVVSLHTTSSNFTSPEALDAHALALPLDIPTSKSWFMAATYSLPAVSNKEFAQIQIDTLLALKGNLTWKFEFSNDQVISRNQTITSVYSSINNIDSTPCP